MDPIVKYILIFNRDVPQVNAYLQLPVELGTCKFLSHNRTVHRIECGIEPGHGPISIFSSHLPLCFSTRCFCMYLLICTISNALTESFNHPGGVLNDVGNPPFISNEFKTSADGNNSSKPACRVEEEIAEQYCKKNNAQLRKDPGIIRGNKGCYLSLILHIAMFIQHINIILLLINSIMWKNYNITS